MSTERLNRSLLAELRALDVARARYQIEHPGAQLGHEDPDVRRMIEALAYSAVRTRFALQRNLQATWRRLLSSYFDFILHPLPAMTFAQALVSANMTETAVLPRGTTLRLTTLDGYPGSFQTLSELRVVPMTLSKCETLFRSQGFRLVLTFVSQYPRGDDVGLLRLGIHYLDSYLAALRVQYNLERHLVRCLAVYDAAPGPDTEGPECAVTFGAHFEEPYEADAQNPLERARSFFHFPEKDLLLSIRVPPSAKTWSRLSLCFDLGPDWPRDPPIYREVFRPFAIPIQNVTRSFAQPIECDGTLDSYPVRFMTDDPSYVMQRALGVYRLSRDGLEPLRATSLSDLHPNYEIEEWGSPLGDTPTAGYSLVVRIPEAFSKPEQIMIDATWHQPEFAQHAIGPIGVKLMDHSVPGLAWQTVGPVRAPLESPLRQDPERLLHLLSLKMKPVLEREELQELLAMYGSVSAGAYRELPQRLHDMAVDVVPDGRLQGAGIRHLYHFMMDPYEPEEEPLVKRFLAQLGAILDAWDYEATVELRPHIGSGPLPDPMLRAQTKAGGGARR